MFKMPSSTSFREKLKKYTTPENYKLGAILMGVFVLGFSLTYFVLTYTDILPKPSPAPVPNEVIVQENIDFPPAPEIGQEEGVYNTILLGYGGPGHAGSLLTDSIIVIHADTKAKKAAIISIPRDLWVSGGRKINAEASVNGFNNMGGVVKSVTGLPVDFFVAINFSQYVKLIDSLGGVNVQVPKSFSDPFYPIPGLENETCGKTEAEIAELKSKFSDAQLEMQFTCRWEKVAYNQGPANLNGEAALKFVRSRHGDGDFARSERQFAVLRGVLVKLLELKSFEKTSGTISTLLKMVNTNLDLEGIRSLIEVVGPTTDYAITDIHLTTGNVLVEGRSPQGAYILYPKAGMLDFSQIKSYINGKMN